MIFPFAFPRLISRVPLHLTVLRPTLTLFLKISCLRVFLLLFPQFGKPAPLTSAYDNPVLSSKLTEIFPDISLL